VNQFSSKKYKSFRTWEKVVFWIGVLSFVSLVYWLVRLILFLVLQNEPLAKRVNAYATQTYIFGWFNIVVFILLIIILSIVATFLGIAALGVLSMQP
jgi:hypothetical protein